MKINNKYIIWTKELATLLWTYSHSTGWMTLTQFFLSTYQQYFFIFLYFFQYQPHSDQLKMFYTFNPFMTEAVII